MGVRSPGAFLGEEPGYLHLPLGGDHGRPQTLPGPQRRPGPQTPTLPFTRGPLQLRHPSGSSHQRYW